MVREKRSEGREIKEGRREKGGRSEGREISEGEATIVE